jgi:hypothetical protein
MEDHCKDTIPLSCPPSGACPAGPPSATPAPPPADGYLPDPPIGAEMPHEHDAHERFIDEWLSVYNSCAACCQPRDWCACNTEETHHG